MDPVMRPDTGIRAELERCGYAALPGFFPAGEQEEMRALLDGHHAAAGAPVLEGFGMGVHPLLGLIPAMEKFFRRPALTAVLEEALGGPVSLVHTGARIADERSMGVLTWHHHYAWPEQGVLGRRRLERLLFGVYVDGSTPESGSFVAFPRGLNDPLTPPHADVQSPWPGEVHVTAPPGSVLIFDTALWHGARRGTKPGRRRLWGAHIQRSDDARPHPEDNCVGFRW